MRFSVQQIKYEFLYAIKEFDSDGTQWSVTTSPLPPADTLKLLGEDVEDFVYLGKPAGTGRAAEIVQTYFMKRFDVIGHSPPVADGIREWVILFRAKQTLPNAADLLEPAVPLKA
ncbi:MAG: hypothetical protein AB8B58_19385 [Roseobacter sp.]